MKINKKKGISLIVLVITIIVILILAGAVILSLANNNPILSANEATFKSDIRTFESELNLYEASQYTNNLGNYNYELLQANDTSVTYNGNVDTSKTIYDLITSLGQNNKYKGMFEVVNGRLVYVGTNDNEQNWAVQSGISAPLSDKSAPTVTFGTNGSTGATVSTTVTVTDVGESNLNTSTLQYTWDIQNVSTPSTGWTSFNNGGTLTKSDNGVYYLWVKAADNAGNTVTIVSNQFVVGSGESAAGIIQTTNSTYAGATTGFSYNNPVIPVGFKPMNTLDARWTNLSTDWNNGLVIEDANGSQYVWVPVDQVNVTYAKWTTVGLSSGSTTDDSTPVSNETTQITNYGGFYIARFETGYVSGKFVSKRNVAVWVNDDYINARNRVVGMCNTTAVKSGLVTGRQWDTTLRWISNNSGPSVTDSRAWGNYSDSTSFANISGHGSMQVTGYSEYWKAKNIYDMAGNAREWINEIYGTYRVYRGGYCSDIGTGSPAAHRGYNPPTAGNAATSFRAVLYVL